MLSPPASSLPYAQATPTQRAQALRYLQARLRPHFPTLPARSFARALEELRPDLCCPGPREVTLSLQDLTYLVQHLATSPELPVLTPPLFGLPALELAQHLLHTSELAVGTIAELEAQRVRCGPRLWGLLQRLTAGSALAEQVVQAWRWDLPSSPRLPPGVPGGGPAPGSPEVARRLQQLAAPGQPKG